MTKPVFDQLNLVVRDMEATVAFYRRLGIEIPDTDATWQLHHRSLAQDGDLDLDFDSVAFAAMWNEGASENTGAVLGFRLESREAVDATYEDMVGAGYRGQQSPYDAFWGARYALVEDPDGNTVGLMSPADRSRATRPPDPPGA